MAIGIKIINNAGAHTIAPISANKMTIAPISFSFIIITSIIVYENETKKRIAGFEPAPLDCSSVLPLYHLLIIQDDFYAKPKSLRL